MKYRTIVADPPWPYEDRPGNFRLANRKGKAPAPHVSMPYSTMTVQEISALPVERLIDDDAHLYLWTTQRFLPKAYDVLAVWGFSPSAVLVWVKRPKGIVGTYVCSTEFCLFARRGSLRAKERHLGTAFEWPRGEHSGKPDAFYDLVERISPGPYLELFARRARFGWDYWGDESLQTVDLEGAA